MRPIKRIDPFLDRFGVLWKQNQDLRFSQLLDLIATKMPIRDPFFFEEDVWAKAIEELIIKENK
jgi:hypothetical protein